MIITLLFHPLLQTLATLLAGYVLWLGIQRFRGLHWRQKVAIKWPDLDCFSLLKLYSIKITINPNFFSSNGHAGKGNSAIISQFCGINTANSLASEQT